MMKVISAEAMRSAERLAMENCGVSGLALMEAAGRNCAEVILSGSGGEEGRRAVVIAGKGNNGGDGYVIARYLGERGWRVRVFVLSCREEISGDAKTNLDMLDTDVVTFCPDAGDLAKHSDLLRSADVVVDAIFGIGLRSVVAGVHVGAIQLINSSPGRVVAVDIPSGVDSTTGRILGVAVRADMTVTFAFAKVGHVLYPGAEHTGILKIVEIGLPEEVINSVEGFEFLDAATVKPLARKRDRNSHKGDYGHCLILAGSTGKTGAAALAANSAVRTGSGLVTLAVPASLNPILEVKTTEAMTLPMEDFGKGWLSGDLSVRVESAFDGKDSVALGPGIGRNPETALLVRRLVEEVEIPMVIDADGLNAVSEDVPVLSRRKSGEVVLTPHPGEMSRLSGMSIDDIEADRIAAARNFADKYGVHVVLKGARTVIAAPDGRVAVNGSGNPGMASGGMGDVLTGIIVSLLGQRYPAFDACRLGVFLHGFAADLVAEDKGEAGISARDVQERLPWALKKLICE
jgi:hydroxyethylthiazole kinase-like uncharacterized protein yjeF